MATRGWKGNWGDVDQEAHDDETAVLPDADETRRSATQTFETQPDKDGIKTVTEFRSGPDGSRSKVTRKVKEIRNIKRINKNVLERRKWTKYGDCAGLGPGLEENITTLSVNEVINLNLKPRNRGEEEEEDDDPFSKIKSDSVVVCRNCGEQGHWTLKCPLRNTITVTKKATPNEGGPVAELAGGSSGKYVPRHLREGAGGVKPNAPGMRNQGDDHSIRVTNISEETTEDDLRALFRRFGHTTRTFLAKDRQTGLSRGFAYISYSRREEAQRAIDALNGHGYDNLILHVEFAKPREDAPNAQSQGAGAAVGKQGQSWVMRGTQ